MRRTLILVCGLVLASACMALVPRAASAAPVPALTAVTHNAMLQNVGWRRWAWRHPVVVAPAYPYVAPVAPVVPAAPVPTCGPYSYWNGYGCVDARYYSPYVTYPYVTTYPY